MDYIFNAGELGKVFRRERKALGITLSQIAERTHYRRQTIAELESGGNVGLHTLMAALAAIGKGLQIVDVRVDYDQLQEIFKDE